MIIIILLIILFLIYYLVKQEHFTCEFIPRGDTYYECIDKCQNPIVENLYGESCDVNHCADICKGCSNIDDEQKKISCPWFKDIQIDKETKIDIFNITSKKEDNNMIINWNNLANRNHYIVHIINKNKFKQNVRILKTQKNNIKFILKDETKITDDSNYLNKRSEYIFFIHAFDTFGLREQSNMVAIKT